MNSLGCRPATIVWWAGTVIGRPAHPPSPASGGGGAADACPELNGLIDRPLVARLRIGCCNATRGGSCSGSSDPHKAPQRAGGNADRSASAGGCHQSWFAMSRGAKLVDVRFGAIREGQGIAQSDPRVGGQKTDRSWLSAHDTERSDTSVSGRFVSDSRFLRYWSPRDLANQPIEALAVQRRGARLLSIQGLPIVRDVCGRPCVLAQRICDVCCGKRIRTLRQRALVASA